MLTLPSWSTARLIISGLALRLATAAVGRFILMDCRRIMLKLAIMNEASRKNIISMSGMISIRAFLRANVEPTFIKAQLRWPLCVLAPELHRVKSLLLGGGDHDFDVGRRGFELELELGQFAGEKVERNQRDDGDGQTAHGGYERLANAAGDRAGGAFDAGAADGQKGLENAGNGAQQPQQRRQRRQRVHDRQKTSRFLQFRPRSHLQGPLQSRVE